MSGQKWPSTHQLGVLMFSCSPSKDCRQLQPGVEDDTVAESLFVRASCQNSPKSGESTWLTTAAPSLPPGARAVSLRWLSDNNVALASLARCGLTTGVRLTGDVFFCWRLEHDVDSAAPLRPLCIVARTGTTGFCRVLPENWASVGSVALCSPLSQPGVDGVLSNSWWSLYVLPGPVWILARYCDSSHRTNSPRQWVWWWGPAMINLCHLSCPWPCPFHGTCRTSCHIQTGRPLTFTLPIGYYELTTKCLFFVQLWSFIFS